MLCQFRFKNFQSYRDEAVLDMQAAGIKEFSDSLIPPPGENFSSLLPVAVIYGPNAGGKSNAICALAYMVSRVVAPIVKFGLNWKGLGMILTEYAPFSLDKDSRNEPTEFELTFRTDSAQYNYFLSILKNNIVEESLSYIKTPAKRRYNVLLFNRKGDKIEVGAPLKKANTEKINPSIPYLSFLAMYSFSEINDALTWFENCCIVNFGVGDSDHTFSPMLNSPKLKPIILNMLPALDIPISDYEIQELAGDGIVDKKYKIITEHTVNGEKYNLDLNQESEGTKKILSILPEFLTSISKGGLLLVDELDAKLHPQLLRILVDTYTDSELNANHAQLVFTCHDISIMRNDILRRDEIWFAAQNNESSSELWSLYDILDENGERVKNTAAYDKQYLAGRYGADPYLKKMLNWGDLDAG